MSQTFKIVFSVETDNGQTLLVPKSQVMVHVPDAGLTQDEHKDAYRAAVVREACASIARHILAEPPSVDVQVGPEA